MEKQNNILFIEYMNKEDSTKKVLEYVNSNNLVRECTKLALDNILLPRWNDFGTIFSEVFRQCVCTKEQPSGNIYDEAKFQTVIRILGGKVFISGRPDSYCWGTEKIKKLTNCKPIGTNSPEGGLNMAHLLVSIDSREDALAVSQMFCNSKQDFLLVHTPEENRKCFQITKELFDLGLTQIVDEWMDTDQDGKSKTTRVYPGDYVIISENGIYRIGAQEFNETHRLIHN